MYQMHMHMHMVVLQILVSLVTTVACESRLTSGANIGRQTELEPDWTAEGRDSRLGLTLVMVFIR